MRIETWNDIPRKYKLVILSAGGILGLLWLLGHLGYLRNTVYLGGLIVIEVVLTSLWHFESIFFLLLMGSFLWAGMDLPWTGVALTGRCFVLAVAAVAGFIMWMRQRKHSYTSFHLVAVFCVTAALVSAMVSSDPRTSILKVLSLFLLFAYGATGARLAIRGREVKFVFGLLRGIEVMTYATAIAYLAGSRVWGNPNSVGAVMGVVIAPFLLWGLLIADTRAQRYRRFGALCICGLLLYSCLSRAGMLSATIGVLTMLVALRRQRLLIQGTFVVLTFVAIAAMVQPSHFDELVTTFTQNVVYKGKPQGGVLGSRRSPWQQTTAVIREPPWFGSGFGTSDMGQFAQGTSLSLAPSTGGLYTREGANREHGNSYLALAEYVGLLGLIPFSVLLFLLGRMVANMILWMRSTSNPRHCAVPLAVMLLAGMVHAFFEDWLMAVGYYLCIFFWVSTFWLADLMPEVVPILVRGASPAHPRAQFPPPDGLVPIR